MDFEQVYQEYAERVYGFLKFKLGDDQIVEDLMQETFTAVYQQMGQVPGLTSVKAWVLSIAHNKMVDYLRRTKLKPIPMAELPEGPSEEDNGTLFLRQALARLDEEARIILYGMYVEELTCKELSHLLGIPEGTVKSKAYYGRNKLRSWMTEEV